VAVVKALVRHVEGHALIARAASHHWVPLDSPVEGAPSAANDPIQLMVIACAGCVMIDTVDILHNKREEFDRLEIEIEALRRDPPPKIIRRLDYRLRINGSGLHEESVRRALELSLTKYCSVSLSLDRSVKFFAQITLNGSTGESWEVARFMEWFEE
jgi:putative redox protein